LKVVDLGLPFESKSPPKGGALRVAEKEGLTARCALVHPKGGEPASRNAQHRCSAFAFFGRAQGR
ncbi:MAG: hypothetical protein ACKOBI_08325, partial [Bacteroidota bacterium]